MDLGFIVVVSEDRGGPSADLEIEGLVVLPASARLQVEIQADARVFFVGLEEAGAISVHPRPSLHGGASPGLTLRQPRAAPEAARQKSRPVTMPTSSRPSRTTIRRTFMEAA